MSIPEKAEKAVCMKIGVNYALIDGRRKPLFNGEYGCPVKIGEEIFIAAEPIFNYLEYEYSFEDKKVNFGKGKKDSCIETDVCKASISGKETVLKQKAKCITSENGKYTYFCIGMQDIAEIFKGLYVTYDKMGLIILSSEKDVVDRNKNMNEMLDIMKAFIFDYAKPEEIYKDLKEHTNGFEHPYLVVHKERFDDLRKAYLAKEGDSEYDADFKKYVTSFLGAPERNYRNFAIPSRTEKVIEDGKEVEKEYFDEYVGLVPEKIPVNPYKDHNGYDPEGGRLNSGVGPGAMMSMALGYQITRNEKYLRCVYDLGIAMGEWNHWGPGHFLNCAGASYTFALALDWCYNGFVELARRGETKYDVNKLVDILYSHGTYQGYYSTVLTDGICLWPSEKVGKVTYTHVSTNWNAVCVSGMIMSALITAEREEYKDASMKLIENNFRALCENGLNEYAPDGAYVESPGYWAYGTGTFFHVPMSLVSSTGKDYGLLNTWGMDTTCYFACHVESSDNHMFNYHDCHYVAQDTSIFFYAGYALKDKNLIAIRKKHLKRGKNVSLMDILFYPLGEKDADGDLPLSYVSEGIDLFTARKSWERGSMFAGIMGGDNSCPHGQTDSGTWVYHNRGKIWVDDIGHDMYNVYHYWSYPTRYRYYKMNAEGNNCLALASRPDEVPFGQELKAKGRTEKYGSNDFGAYTVIDNKEVYGGFAESAKRGMLVTNDRNTVVVQDEVTMKNPEDLYWFAHYELRFCSGEVMADGRTAILSDDAGNKIRLSIISDTKDLKFEIMSAYDLVLKGENGTVDKEYSVKMGGVAEHNREGIRKLAIKALNVKTFKCAVVVEDITDGETEVGYKWTDMKDWEPQPEYRK